MHEGRIASLRRFNEDAREVGAGFECGLLIEDYNDVKEGDQIEAYELREVARTVPGRGRRAGRGVLAGPGGGRVAGGRPGVECGHVGILTVNLHLPEGASLKTKRKELLRLKSALAKRFACAVAEVDHHDLWQRSRLTLAIVGREAGETDERLLAGLAVPPLGRGVPGGGRGARADRGLRATRPGAGRLTWRAASAPPACAGWTPPCAQVLAEAVARELSDPRLGFVTITRVEATQDTREAKVWFSTLRPRDREASLAALESARGLLQARVAAELRSRHTPQLTFHYDSTQQDAARLTQAHRRGHRRPGRGEDA